MLTGFSLRGGFFLNLTDIMGPGIPTMSAVVAVAAEPLFCLTELRFLEPEMMLEGC